MTSADAGRARPRRVLVVGAGVVGLACAVRLLEAGHRVDVVARDLPRESTSAVAAALWHPSLCADRDRERLGRWAAASYRAYAAQAAHPDGGVRLLPGIELPAEVGDPWWASVGPQLATISDPAPGHRVGRRLAAPVVDMPVYLDRLRHQLIELGGTLTRLNLRALPEGADAVVNCAGIGARLLAGDLEVEPVREQVAHVAPCGVDGWWLDVAGPTYVVPRSDHVVVGATVEEGDWSRTPSLESARAILERAARLVPALGDAQVLRHRVGLRPQRPAVRVEREGRVVHCYGHGGAGVTLAWGCADEVVGLVADG